jgi:hypothetical protein
MKRILITTALLLGTALGAQAHTNDTYYDTNRPHGHPRSDAIFQTALDACYGRTGASRFSADTPAFKQCMLGRGYRWESVRIVRSRGSGSSGWDSGGWDPSWSNPPDTPLPVMPDVPTPSPPPDPTTGMPIPGYGP